MAKSFAQNIKGFRELRRSPEVMADLNRRGARVKKAAGPGWELRESKLSTRGRVGVRPATVAAKRALAKDPGLATRALEAGRD